MNKVRKLAGDLLAKYPTIFSANFESNKKALEQVAIIRNRALRNQIAGAITSLAAEMAPSKSDSSVELEDVMSTTIGSSMDQSSAEVTQEAQ